MAASEVNAAEESFNSAQNRLKTAVAHVTFLANQVDALEKSLKNQLEPGLSKSRQSLTLQQNTFQELLGLRESTLKLDNMRVELKGYQLSIEELSDHNYTSVSVNEIVSQHTKPSSAQTPIQERRRNDQMRQTIKLLAQILQLLQATGDRLITMKGPAAESDGIY